MIEDPGPLPLVHPAPPIVATPIAARRRAVAARRGTAPLHDASMVELNAELARGKTLLDRLHTLPPNYGYHEKVPVAAKKKLLNITPNTRARLSERGVDEILAETAHARHELTQAQIRLQAINNRSREEVRQARNTLEATLNAPYIKLNKEAEKAHALHKHICELERLAQSADPVVRRRAEYELRNAQDLVHLSRGATNLEDTEESEQNFESAPSSVSSLGVARRKPSKESQNKEATTSEREISRSSQSHNSPQRLSGEFDNPAFEWDEEQPIPSPIAGDNHQDITIRTPSVSINIRPANSTTQERRVRFSTPLGSPQPARRTHRGMPAVDFDNWLESLNSESVSEAQQPPTQTRSGRVVKAPDRFDSNQENIRERELKDISKAIKLSKLEASELQASRAQEQDNLEQVLEDAEGREEDDQDEEDEIPPPND